MKYPEEYINKVICSDCLEVMKGIPDKSIDLVLTDPPYITTNEKWDKKEVVNEELSNELLRIAKDSCSLYVWCGIGEKSQSLIRWFSIFNRDWYFKDLITWKKQRGIGMRKGWLFTREEIMWFVKDNNNFVWNIGEQYSENKRKTSNKNTKYVPKSKFLRISNVWVDISEATTGNLKNKEKLHIAIKPIKALERIIKVHTKKNDLILDCFGGSGTTGRACKNLGRNFILIEKEEKYCRIAENRLKQEVLDF